MFDQPYMTLTLMGFCDDKSCYANYQYEHDFTHLIECVITKRFPEGIVWMIDDIVSSQYDIMLSIWKRPWLIIINAAIDKEALHYEGFKSVTGIHIEPERL